MKSKKQKKAVLDQLKQLPIIEVACKKSDISRATFYRWKKEDLQFSKMVDEAMSEGEKLINDMSESQLIAMIKDRNFQSIQLWLKHHHPKYTNKVEVSGNVTINDPLSKEQIELVQKGLSMIGLLPKEGGQKDDSK